MPALPLNKSSLKSERDKLKTYERFLPSLDLKRRQLMAERKRAVGVLAATEREIAELNQSLEGLWRVLGSSEMDVSGLVRTEAVETDVENVLGVRLPVLRGARFRVADYSMLAKPFWVDVLVESLQQAAGLYIRRQIERERVARLEEAVRRITQRVNLFEKVLIPNTRRNIQRIRIWLSDAERAAVVRAKIAKTKRLGRQEW